MASVCHQYISKKRHHIAFNLHIIYKFKPTAYSNNTTSAISVSAHSYCDDPMVKADINKTAKPSVKTLRGLDWLNFFLADVQTGVGPFLAIYLAGHAWNEQQVGWALTVGGIATIMAQTPAGALVDRAHRKRSLIAVAIFSLVLSSLAVAFFPQFWPVMAAQIMIGATSSIFIPALCAISLGIVGHRLFDRRQGRNQTFNSAGNVFAALIMGLLGFYISDRSIFFFVVFAAIPALWTLRLIKPDEIDYDKARGADQPCTDTKNPAPSLLRNKPLVIFLICSVFFHFANAAMLPLLGQMLAKGHGRESMMFMSACVITTQIVITCLAAWAGCKASRWGRKPLLVIAFAALPIRAYLYTLTEDTLSLVAIQVLDGIAAGIFGVVSILVIADLTRGTGRFNLTLGAITTAVGIGAALSQLIAGSIVHHYGFNNGFLFLAVIALAALVLLVVAMPETKCADDVEIEKEKIA